MVLARACGGATGRVVQGIAASIQGTAFPGRNVSAGVRSFLDDFWGAERHGPPDSY